MSKKWLEKQIKGLLLDITGVLYESGCDTAIAGSVDAIKRLRQNGIPFRFCTNETQRTTDSLVSKLRRFGYELDKSEVIAPAPAVRHMLIKQNLRPYLLIYPELMPEFADIDQSNANCVVVGDAAQHFTYDAVNKAFQLLLSMKDPLLISMGKGKYYKEGNELVLDLGAYTAALEYATDNKAVIMGKPAKEYYMTAIDSMNLKPEDVVMIGDDINSDVGGAQQMDMRGLLVRTGKYRPSDENHTTVKPDAIVNNLADAVNQILTHRAIANNSDS
ncbi:phospholysine phosphohistidine inorganic pyrophosphate phosphatase-like [Oppia nitens]|uniref:phospholysine phosphohistidine inorganic pyrophosphate phosphatase-like n=1 Tax=Oppia nitens TaxID=1686743 RepID=UPI0023DBD923|nr:phospholysine phosphohistidine inorganic pyrophosphate phosphatase-like [Oppia nitens]